MAMKVTRCYYSETAWVFRLTMRCHAVFFLFNLAQQEALLSRDREGVQSSG
jgi:hypothetical protein